jgi:outer membrane porin, OprD family
MMTRFYILFILLVFNPAIYAAEYILDEQPSAESVEDVKGTLDQPEEAEVLDPEIDIIPKDDTVPLAPFWKNSQLIANVRSYYFDRDSDLYRDSEAFTLGGSLHYHSGWFKDTVKIGASLFTSQRLYGPEDKDGTLLLREGQHGLTTLGEFYVQAKLARNIEFKGYRQAINLPYLNKQDNRMIPNTFEAYIVTQRRTNSMLTAGYVDKMKQRNVIHFESMTDIVGLSGKDRGLYFFGGRYNFSENTDFGVINYHTPDYINTFYTEANHLIKTKIPVRLSLQATKQRSNGDELGGELDTYQLGGKVSLSYKNIILTAAATSTDEDGGIQKPYGGSPSYTSVMIEDFDRAGEDAWSMRVSYHFGRLGIKGLSVYTNYISGNTPESGAAASSDQKEWDMTIDYKPEKKKLDGLWLRLRRAKVDRDDGKDVLDYRIILNYGINFS